MKEEKRNKDYQQMFEMVISALKVVRPSLTDEQATNVIINLANWKQLQTLSKMKEE